MSRSAAILASLLVTLGRPSWWAIALAAFLVRGGVVLALVPIVVLPSPLAISSLVAPWVMSLAFGRISAELIAVVGLVLAALLGWLVGGGWLAAAMDVVLIRSAADAAAEEGLPPDAASGSPTGQRRRDRTTVSRVLAARLIAMLPFALAVVFGVARIVAVTYTELTQPFETATPLVARVIGGALGELALIGVAWAFGETVAGLAARRIVLGRDELGSALRGAVRDVVVRPLSTIVPWLAATAFLAAILGASLGAAGIAWSRAVVALSEPKPDGIVSALALLVFVAIWLSSFVLGGLFASIRGTIQTFDELRDAAAGIGAAPDPAAVPGEDPGTFGASTHHRPGDWSMHDRGGSL